MSESEQKTGGRRERGRGALSRQIKKKSMEWTALNGFSTLYYEDISPLFHSEPTCTDTPLSPHTILPTALSLSAFITLTQSVQHRALQMLSSAGGPTTFSHFSKLALLSYLP